MAAKDLTPRQRLLLILILGGAPLLLLVALELGLLAAGYGGRPPLFVAYDPAPEYLVPNPSIGLRYFPGSNDPPRPPTDIFRADKSPGSLRLFVQGASSAAGFPYSYGGAFSKMLEERLTRQYPDREVEVVNTAITATNSYTLLDLADEIIAQQPDAVLIYVGHNEFYGAYGVGSAVLAGRVPAITRGYLWMTRLRAVQLVRSLVGPPAGEGKEPWSARTLMERMAAEQSIPLGSGLRESGVRQFRSNLRRLLEKYRNAGVPVFIATVASNERDLPPFSGAPEDEDARGAFASRLAQVRAALGAGDTVGGILLLRQGVLDQPLAADPRFALATTFDRIGQYDSALVHYSGAIDLDRLPFRAPSAVNEVIRDEARRADAILVDALGRLRRASPQGIIGNELILEHVHPNIQGQFLISEAFLDGLREAGSLGEAAASGPDEDPRQRVPVTAVDSLIGEFHIQRLTAGFPFQPQGVVRVAPVDTLRPRNQVEAIALEFYRGRINWIDAQRRLSAHYATTGQFAEAMHVDRVLALELPLARAPLFHAAVVARFAGRLDLVERFLAEARDRGAQAEALFLEGGLLATRGDTAAARERYQQAAQLAMQDSQFRLAPEALAAIPGLETRARERPTDPGALSDLGAVYYLTAQYDRARDMVSRALLLAPGNEAALNLERRMNQLLTT